MSDELNEKTTPGEIAFGDLTESDKSLVEKALRNGTYTRRDALKLMMATGVTMAAANNILSTGQVARAQTPKKGGSVRYASNLHGPDDQLDPTLFTSSIDYTRGRATYNCLTQHADDLVPQPDLATSFEPNSDATEWTFKLREGVTFHDGSAFGADDVVWSMNRHIGDESTSVVKSVLASVKEWKKVGPHEVKAIMNSPNADLPTLLGIFQTKIVKNGSTGEGNGTGPYILEAFEPGVKSVHKRNENYWREGGNLDAIEF